MLEQKNCEISICIGTYNRIDYLKRLLDSIAIQKYKNFEVIITDDSSNDSIEQYLKTRTKRQKDEILTSIQIPRGDFRSAHVRLLMRKAGEYPIANLSIRYSIDETGSVQEARIVVGAVESTVRRWIKLENALNNKRVRFP